VLERLARGLAKEAGLHRGAENVLLFRERKQYLPAVQAALAGAEAAPVVLAGVTGSSLVLSHRRTGCALQILHTASPASRNILAAREPFPQRPSPESGLRGGVTGSFPGGGPLFGRPAREMQRR
jgi:hypothetical protein